jgi:hypothetical protein
MAQIPDLDIKLTIEVDGMTSELLSLFEDFEWRDGKIVNKNPITLKMKFSPSARLTQPEPWGVPGIG